MPPKTRGSSKKRASTAREKDKQAKKKKDTPAPSSSPSSSAVHRADMGSRAVVTGRQISFRFLEAEDFNIAQWLRFQGWERFCTLHIPTYPHLVREFFGNLRLGGDSIWSTVKGEDLVLDQTKIGNLLDMPTEGAMYLDIPTEYNGLQRLLGREDVGNIDYHNGNHLPVELKLLHSMTARIFFPRTGRFDWVSRRDLAFMVHVIEEKPINLPFLMLGQIKEAGQRGRVKFCLPYGMLFTLLFKDAEIDLTGEDTMVLGHTDLYSAQTLKRMHYSKVQGVWVRRVEGGPPAPAAPESSSTSSSSSDSEGDGAGATRAPGTPMSDIRPTSPAAPPSPVIGPTPPSAGAEHVPSEAASPHMRRGRRFEEHQVDTIIAALGSRLDTQIDALACRFDARFDGLSKRLDESDKAVSEKFEAMEIQLTEVIDRVSSLELETPSGTGPSAASPSSSTADLRAFISAELDGHRVTAEGRHSDMMQRLQILSQRMETLEKLQPPPPPTDLKDLHCQITFLTGLAQEMNNNQRKSLKLFVDAIVQLSAKVDGIFAGASTSQTFHTPGPSARPVPPPTVPLDIIPIAIRPPFSATVRPGTGFTPRPAGPSSRTRRSRPRGRGSSTAGSSAAMPHEVAPSDEE